MENLGVDASLHPWLPAVWEDIHSSSFPDIKAELALLVEQTVGRDENSLQSDELGVWRQKFDYSLPPSIIPSDPVFPNCLMLGVAGVCPSRIYVSF